MLENSLKEPTKSRFICCSWKIKKRTHNETKKRYNSKKLWEKYEYKEVDGKWKRVIK